MNKGLINHTVMIGDDELVSSVRYGNLGVDNQVIINFKKDLPDNFYKYDIDVSKNTTESMDVGLHGDCGAQGYDSQIIYRYQAHN